MIKAEVQWHRLWSNFESGGGAHNVSEASKRSRIACEEGDVTRTDNFLRMALVLGVLLAVCCYFGNLGNTLLCESYYFSTTNYTN